MSTDSIADLLTRIRNATLADLKQTIVPHSKFKEDVLKVMKATKYIKDYKVGKNEKGFQEIQVTLDLENQKDINLKRISKPGCRTYSGKQTLPVVCNNLGIAIVTTSKGVMTNQEAKKQGLGGEVICEIW